MDLFHELLVKSVLQDRVLRTLFISILSPYIRKQRRNTVFDVLLGYVHWIKILIYRSDVEEVETSSEDFLCCFISRFEMFLFDVDDSVGRGDELCVFG